MTLNASSLRIVGGTPLTGAVAVRGAKNLVPKAMVAALLGSTPSTLRNIPDVVDVDVVSGLLKLHGVTVDRTDGQITMDPGQVDHAEPAEINVHAGSSRIPILMCGPLIHRLGRAFIPDLGGCKIGDRPIDFHLDALRQMGAKVRKEVEGLYIDAPDGLHGTQIELSFPSVGATEQVLLSAVLAEGTTELRNAAIEPEIMDLICILQKMGAQITVHSNRVVRIEGVSELEGFDHWALTDRLEAASWACAALATKGDITVLGAEQEPMLTFLNVFRQVGGKFQVNDGGDGREKSIRFWHPEGGKLNAVAIETNVAPGFQTDWQQPLVVALTQAEGLSIVHETVYENRLGFTSALGQMGARIQVYRECLGGSTCRFGQRNFQHSAVISGPAQLHGAELVIPDLRGGFSYLIAALAAEGESTLHGVELIYRGYENFLQKLSALNAKYEEL